MNLFIFIKYFLALAVIIYISGIISIWIYARRQEFLYRKMQGEMKLLENIGLSGAVMQIKAYRIREDYRRELEMIERVQSFILKICHFFASRNEGNEGSLLFRSK